MAHINTFFLTVGLPSTDRDSPVKGRKKERNIIGHTLGQKITPSETDVAVKVISGWMGLEIFGWGEV